MPTAAPKPCKDCGALVYDGSQRCPAHKVKAGSFADKRRGSRHERGYGTAWDKARAETLRDQAGLCQPHLRRGIVVPNCRIVDHIVPKAQGGTDAKSNRQTICDECHALKTRVEALLARGLPVDADPEALASLTPGGGQISEASCVRTEPQGKFSRAGNLGGGGIPTASKGAA